MSTTQTADQGTALVERIFGASIAFMDIFSIYLGDKLGYYRALASRDSLTASDLAGATSTNTRYAREWLEHQAVGGFIKVDDTGDAETRRFSLPPGHVDVLTNEDSLMFVAPFAQILMGMTVPLEGLLKSYRTGIGVPYPEYGEDTRIGIARGTRAMFINLLASEWVPALPDIEARLAADPPARIADFGCGSGWSSIALAQGFPKVHVDGLDIDDNSILAARDNATGLGLDERLTFVNRDAGDPELHGAYDFACAFECIHDMSDPVSALRSMHNLVGDGGTVLIGDERVADSFNAPGDDLERLMYGFSIIHCLPVGTVEQPSAATGTVMRPSTLEQYAHEAGFVRFEVLPIENDLWRFYRLGA
jgi:SAM-dependent methyltransferase